MIISETAELNLKSLNLGIEKASSGGSDEDEDFVDITESASTTDLDEDTADL